MTNFHGNNPYRTYLSIGPRIRLSLKFCFLGGFLNTWVLPKKLESTDYPWPSLSNSGIFGCISFSVGSSVFIFSSKYSSPPRNWLGSSFGKDLDYTSYDSGFSLFDSPPLLFMNDWFLWPPKLRAELLISLSLLGDLTAYPNWLARGPPKLCNASYRISLWYSDTESNFSSRVPSGPSGKLSSDICNSN